MTIVSKSLLAIVMCCVLGNSHAATTPDERFAEAQQLMRDGAYPLALASLESLLQAYPRNVDYLYAYGLALSRSGRDSEAVAQLELATRLAPDYEELWRAHHNVLVRQQDAQALAGFRGRAAEQFPRATWWRTPGPPRRWWLTLGGGFDSLDNDQPNWDNQFVELRYDVDQSQHYAVGASRNSRNNASDLSLSVSGAWSWDKWITGASLSFADDPDVMSDLGAELYAGRSFNGGWVGTLRYRYRGYANATVSSVILNTEKYFGDFRVAYDLGLSRLHGASRFNNHVLTGNWFYADGASIGLSLSTGREAEAIGGGRVLETDVESISLNGRHPINDRTSLQWWLGIHDQGELYRRQFLGLAVSIGI